MVNHERRPPDPTEPLPSRPAPRTPLGGTNPLRRSGGPRFSRPGIPGRLVAVAVGALVVAFVLGFFVGNAGDDPAPSAPASEGAGQVAGGGGKCRRRALTQSARTIALQREALANRTEFTRAALAGDEERLVALNQALEPISRRLEALQSKLDATLERCGRRGGGGDGGGGGGG